jgi:hypothetical protein
MDRWRLVSGSDTFTSQSALVGIQLTPRKREVLRFCSSRTGTGRSLTAAPGAGADELAAPGAGADAPAAPGAGADALAAPGAQAAPGVRTPAMSSASDSSLKHSADTQISREGEQISRCCTYQQRCCTDGRWCTDQISGAQIRSTMTPKLTLDLRVVGPDSLVEQRPQVVRVVPDAAVVRVEAPTQLWEGHAEGETDVERVVDVNHADWPAVELAAPPERCDRTRQVPQGPRADPRDEHQPQLAQYRRHTTREGLRSQEFGGCGVRGGGGGGAPRRRPGWVQETEGRSRWVLLVILRYPLPCSYRTATVQLPCSYRAATVQLPCSYRAATSIHTPGSWCPATRRSCPRCHQDPSSP